MADTKPSSASHSSKQPDDGYIKFCCRHQNAEWYGNELPVDAKLKKLFDETDNFRTKVFDQGFIGMYENGIGYGNLSFRWQDKFIITASATGGARELGMDGYTLVVKTDIARNTVESKGPLPASSETMSHAVVYAKSPKANFVLHIHNKILFDMLLKQNALATPENIAYGTPEMAYAIAEIVQKHPAEATIVMAGHDEGILIYGMNIAHIQAQLVFLCQEAKNKQCSHCKKGECHD